MEWILDISKFDRSDLCCFTQGTNLFVPEHMDTFKKDPSGYYKIRITDQKRRMYLDVTVHQKITKKKKSGSWGGCFCAKGEIPIITAAVGLEGSSIEKNRNFVMEFIRRHIVIKTDYSLSVVNVNPLYM
jgi:hypothetical protein